MHTVQNYKLCKDSGKQDRTAMLLIVLKWKNWLGKVSRICKLGLYLRRICNYFGSEF